MPYQNDMMSLADVVGGAAAAQQAGIQNANENQQQAIETQIKQATMPQEIAKAQLSNNLLQAQGQNESGVAAQNLAAGQTALGAQPSAAAAQIGGNQAKLTESHVQQLQSLGQIVGVMDQQLQNVPAAARPALVAQFLDQNGVQDPSIRQTMINAAGQEGGLTQVSQGLFQASNAARQTLLAENTRGGYQLGVAGVEAGSREQVAKEAADARRYVADQKAQVDRLKQTTDQALAQVVSRIGTPQEQPQDRAQAQFLQQHSEQLRQMQALTTQQLLGMPVPSPDLAAIPQANTGVPQASASAVPAGALDMNAWAEELRRRGALK